MTRDSERVDDDNSTKSPIDQIRDFTRERGQYWFYEKYPLSAATGTAFFLILAVVYFAIGDPISDVFEGLGALLLTLSDIWVFLVPLRIRVPLQNPLISGPAILITVALVMRFHNEDADIVEDVLLIIDGLGNLVGLLLGGVFAIADIISDNISVTNIVEQIIASFAVKVVMAIGGIAALAWLASSV